MNKDIRHSNQTDWEALQAMTDEDIDYSEILPLSDDFFRKAKLRQPSQKGGHVTQAQNDSDIESN